jgi:hypothetical protein
MSAAFEATKATNMENFHSTKTVVQNTGLRLEAQVPERGGNGLRKGDEIP